MYCWVKKRIKKLGQRKLILPTPVTLLFSKIVLSVLTPNLNFSKTLMSGQARFKHFPGALPKDLLHYIDPTLEEQNFEAAIIHIGVNYIL